MKEDGALLSGAPAVADTTVAAATDTVATDTVAVATEVVAAVATEAVPAVATEAVAADTAPAPTVLISSTEPLTTVAPATTQVPTTTVGPAAQAPAEEPVAAPADASASAAPPPLKILFGITSPLLDGESTTSVKQLATHRQGNPDVRIKVVDHTDKYGTRLTNMSISRARADAVVSALVAGGIDRSRMSALGQGSRLPIESNATADGRRADRRVDIVFFGADGSGGRNIAFTG